MWFTDGLWQPKIGYSVHSAHNAWEWKVEDKKVKVFVPCNEIRSLKDTIGGPPNLHFEFAAPRKDMIAVKIFHFIGKRKIGPEFELNYDEIEPEIIEDESVIRMKNGRMEVVIHVEGEFGFEFYYDGKYLTGSGKKGTAYITDVDYEADKRSDYNGRTRSNYRKETYVRERLSLDVGEYIYGLGERFNSIIRNGQSVDIWNRDGGTMAGNQAYKNIPFYLSNKGYGVLVNSTKRVSFEVASVSVRHVEMAVEGEDMEYIVVGGSEPKEVLSNYTGLIGRTPIPPAWTFGLWLSTSWTPDSDEKITYDTIDKMAEYKIPLSVFHFDARWMDDFKCCDFVWSERYGDAPAMLKKVHEKGARVCVWMNPYVSQESRLFQEGLENGYFVKTKEGDVWQSDNWMSGIGIVDFTNPKATKWYQERLGEIIDMGVDAIKTDFGERIPTDVVYYDGSDPVKMHNYYPYLYNQAIYGILKEKKGEAVVFSRSATVGTQKFPVNWGGDNDSTYISMAETLRGCLSLCQSGYGYAAHDISGFQNTATPDLYKRWVQFGLLSTHSRLHGEESYRAPWYFDEESCEVLKFFTNLKCSLMPYLYSGAVQVQEEGIPLMRAMMLEFPEDPVCLYLERQYMLGDNLMVAPIFNQEGIVEFYVPGTGRWTNYIDGRTYEGGHWYKEQYDYFNLPLLVRPGTILAVGAVQEKPEYDYAKNVTFKLYEIPNQYSQTCSVYNTEGEEVLVLKVIRENDDLILESIGKSDDFSVQLCGAKYIQEYGKNEADADIVVKGKIGRQIIHGIEWKHEK